MSDQQAGRSRGRARIVATGAPSAQPPSGGPPLHLYAGGAHQQTPSPPTSGTPSPPLAAQPPGRGRGFSTAESTITTATTLISAVPSVATSAGNTQTSSATVERSSSHSDSSSPQKQHSPQQPPPAMGRATARGGPHQPAIAIRGDVVTGMERMILQDQGDVQAGAGQARREVFYEQVLRTRPANCTQKTGEAGTPVTLLCNYFEVINKPDWVLYQYHVDYFPPIESKRMRIALMHNHDALFPTNKAFDGGTLYSLTRLDELTEVASTRQTDQEIITIKIKRVGEIVPTSPQFVHLFNLVFRRCLSKYGMKQIGRDYFDTSRRINMKEYNLDLISGFNTFIANYENRLLMCAELTHKLLHSSTIHDLMNKIWQDSQGMESRFKERCMAELVGRIVMTKYNEKTYKVDDISWNEKPTSTFPTRQGPVTYLDYYKKHYDIQIRDNNQPLLISLPSEKDKRRGQDTPIQLIPELCCVTGVDEKMKDDFRFKKALDVFTKINAPDRCKRLADFVHQFKSNEGVRAELDKWQMDFSSKPAEIKARCLPPEVLGFGNVTRQLNEKADWGNDIKGVALLLSVELSDWIIVFPHAKRQTANFFIQTYCDVIRSMEIKANRPKECAIARDDANDIKNALKQNITATTQLVVVIVTSKRKDRYDTVKRICCLEKPVPSQVVTSMIIDDERKRRSVITKVAIQMNCKLGGEIWKLHIPMANVMICGIDTYHDSAKKKGSVCAFIATSNPTKTRFFSRASLQETHQELSNNLTITVKSACEHYRRINNTLPEKIIIYRDGVSDGQLPLIMDYEIPQIKKAFELIGSDYIPVMSFVVVKKRGNARFFANTGAGISNPPCGTVIDSVVTRAEWFDFYLISQCVTQGTVNPTHYNVVYETIGLKADHYQKLSFKLTHMYYNWPGTIRVPALCQYAHKLAFLVGQSLHKEHHGSLSDKLFYL